MQSAAVGQVPASRTKPLSQPRAFQTLPQYLTSTAQGQVSTLFPQQFLKGSLDPPCLKNAFIHTLIPPEEPGGAQNSPQEGLDGLELIMELN